LIETSERELEVYSKPLKTPSEHEGTRRVGVGVMGSRWYLSLEGREGGYVVCVWCERQRATKRMKQPRARGRFLLFSLVRRRRSDTATSTNPNPSDLHP